MAIFGLGVVSASYAKNCAVSKEFHVPKAQHLSGVFKDASGGVLPGVKIDLSTHKTVFQSLRTDNDGRFDFGEVPPGKYRIRVRYGDDEPFCAPKIECGEERCRIDPTLSISDKHATLVN